MKVTVFSEFAALQLLSSYCTVTVLGPIILNGTESDEIKLIARTNIKIFFDSKNTIDRDAAYTLQTTLSTNNIATFVTDQLYSTHKDSKTGKTYNVPLTKDRIIMKLNHSS